MRGRIILVLSLAACSGGGKKVNTPVTPAPDAEAATPVTPEEAPVPDKPVVGDIAPPPPQTTDHPPVLSPVPWTQAGVGQTISFAATAIDADLDETAVTVTAMPAGAKLDPLTRTVTWTPSKKDMPKGTFTFHIANLDADGKETHSWDQSIDIAVVKKKVAPPRGATQDTLAETVLTIRDPARLAKVNKDWPIDKTLLKAAEILRGTLPPEAQTKLAKNDPKDQKKKLFTSFLAALAATHGNPRLDPTSKQFDKKTFGDPKDWQLIVIRPRIDKKWSELRLVYQAVKAPEPVFAMFRFRPTWDTPTVPPEARAYDNKVFLDMVARHLMPDGAPSDKFMKNAKSEAKPIDDLVNELLSYDDSKTNPWARAGFSAIATEARMGGGTRMGADGNYRSGDGWAWAVVKPMPNADGTAQAFVDIGIPGFWTDVTASPDGTSWAPKCASKYNPDDPNHQAGLEVLCRKANGFVDLPDIDASGKVASGKKDASNLFLEYKSKDEVAALPLDDGRRDNGEENGMTCQQCHERTFTIHDWNDPANFDPRQGTPKAPNAPMTALDFQIIPTQVYPDFLITFMKDQECRAQKAMAQFLGADKTSGLTCPLSP